MSEFDKLMRAAAQGNLEAQHNLGKGYFNGEGVGQDYAQAAKWFAKAAEQGNAAAQCFLGFCYSNGEGVARDVAQAAIWLTKSAEQGF
ncbi:MAG: sel1 repeat family protein, partial [Nitrososphaerota archaeon]|nr:sel1 repeat family protein [Nitrososphaerota archaeon]